MSHSFESCFTIPRVNVNPGDIPAIRTGQFAVKLAAVQDEEADRRNSRLWHGLDRGMIYLRGHEIAARICNRFLRVYIGASSAAGQVTIWLRKA
jgi:hypothetical protein